MKSFLDTIFFRSNNLDYISQNIKDLTKKTPTHKIFKAINSFSSESERCKLKFLIVFLFVLKLFYFEKIFETLF